MLPPHGVSGKITERYEKNQALRKLYFAKHYLTCITLLYHCIIFVERFFVVRLFVFEK